MTHTARFVIAAPWLLFACAHHTTIPSDPPAAEYRIGREDLLEISVWKDAALSTTAPVRPDGQVSVPMIGDVTADGKTTHELGAEITRRLAPLVKDPVVSVIVREINSAKFSIVGEVAKPGVYPMRGTTSVLQAVALAGGLTEFASKGGIVLIRRTVQSGQEERFAIDYDEIIDGKMRTVPKLQSGDTLYVP